MGQSVRKTFLYILLNPYENPYLLGIYLFINEETESPKV